MTTILDNKNHNKKIAPDHESGNLAQSDYLLLDNTILIYDKMKKKIM